MFRLVNDRLNFHFGALAQWTWLFSLEFPSMWNSSCPHFLDIIFVCHCKPIIFCLLYHRNTDNIWWFGDKRMLRCKKTSHNLSWLTSKTCSEFSEEVREANSAFKSYTAWLLWEACFSRASERRQAGYRERRRSERETKTILCKAGEAISWKIELK